MSTMIQAGSIDLSSTSESAISDRDTSTFTPVNFPTPFPDGSKVIVVPMVQTFNGSDTPGVRIAKVNTEGFLMRMNEVVYNKGGKSALSNGKHNKETIGWVAYSV